MTDEPRAVAGEDVKVMTDTLLVKLSDGRTITAPLAWFPWLMHGSVKERNHWPDLDEDISIEGLNAWCDARKTSKAEDNNSKLA